MEIRFCVRAFSAAICGISAATRSSCTSSHPETEQTCPNSLDHVVILSGTASRQLAQKISVDLHKSLGKLHTDKCTDGEVHPRVDESLRGKHVFLVQSCSPPANETIMELLLTISAIRRADAATVTAVVPYFGYRYHRRSLPISTHYHSRFLWSSAGDLAKLMQTSGVDNVISVDLQRPGQGHEACFFDTRVPIETISANDAFVRYFIDNVGLRSPIVVVSSNTECVKKAQKFQSKLRTFGNFESVDYAAFLHDSPDGNASEFYNPINSEFLGDVRGADVIVVDDVIDTAGTMSILCQRLRKEGARRVFLCASHGIFSRNSMQLIDLSPVEQVVVSDTIALPAVHSKKIVQVSVSNLLANVIAAEANGTSPNRSKLVKNDDDDTFEAE